MADTKISDLTASTTPDSDDIIEVEVDGVSKSVTLANAVSVGAGGVLKTLYDANTILAANTDDTPAAITVAEQQVVGRLTGGNIKALTATELTALLNNASEALGGKAELATLAEVTAGTSTSTVVTPQGLKQETDLLIPKTILHANTALIATSDHTPIELALAASTFLGRKSSGNIVALTAAEALAILGSTFTLNMKVVSNTRVLDAASEDVDYTDAGFQPTAVMVLATLNSTEYLGACFGFANSITNEFCTRFYTPSGSPISNNLVDTTSSGVGQIGNFKATLANGITIAWTKVGTPAASKTIGLLMVYFG